jgi:DNA-binding transcriptional LysR family regulator
MLNEFKIKCFLCLSDTLSFTEVGKRLYISQQAVSKHIANLEKDIGVSLFIRTRNKVELTAAGDMFHHFFKEAGARYNTLISELREGSDSETMTIRIGYQNWLALGSALSTAMTALREQAPELHLIGERHDPSALISMLENLDLDMILIHGRFTPNKAEFSKLLLIETPMQVVVAKSDPLCVSGADYRAFSPRALIIDAFEGESRAETIKRARMELRPYNLMPETIIVVPNRDSVYTEAELGRGIFLSSSMTQAMQNDMLTRFDTDVMEGLYCVWRKNTSNRYVERYARQLQHEYLETTK